MSLSPTGKKSFRQELERYCLVAEKYRSVWHYTQARPFTGYHLAPSAPHYNDCSGYLGLMYWWAGHISGYPVADPLGYHNTGWGNTDSAYQYLKAHHAPPDKYLIGDVALYLQGPYAHHHVTVCRSAGTAQTAWFSSNGSEADPRPTRLYYRDDLTGVFRHPALL